jgi:hypothetical protein
LLFKKSTSKSSIKSLFSFFDYRKTAVQSEKTYIFHFNEEIIFLKYQETKASGKPEKESRKKITGKNRFIFKTR